MIVCQVSPNNYASFQWRYQKRSVKPWAYHRSQRFLGSRYIIDLSSEGSGRQINIDEGCDSYCSQTYAFHLDPKMTLWR